jgi:hypothetical protein
MGQTSAWAQGVAESIGGNRSSDYRSPEEQDALFEQGVTRLRGGESAHNRGTPERPGAIDVTGLPGGNPAQVEAMLRAQGHNPRKVVWEKGGRNQGTAPHYHIEFEDGTTVNSVGTGKGEHAVNLQDVSTIQPTAAETAAMQTPRDSVATPFDPALTSNLRGAVQTEGERLSFADSLLTSVIDESHVIREGLEQDLQQTVEAKRAINDQTRSQLDSLAAVAEPVWQKREQLARQMLHLDDMNPLEQGLRSMFDPNYNRRALRAEIRSQEAALGELNLVFEERYKHSQLLAQLATADYNDTEALANLMLQNGGEDVRLALQSFNLAGQQVDTLLSGLEADSALIVARQQARADVLSGMSIGQVNSALATAQSSPLGVVEVNGIPLRTGELQEAQTRFQSQSLAMQNTKIAIQQGNLELAEANKKSIVETMTIDDIQSAIQADGMFHGIQFDPTVLAERMQRLQQSNQVFAQQQTIETAPGLSRSMIQQLEGTRRMQTLRFTSLFGQVPQEMTRYSQAYAAQLNAFTTGLRQAEAQGTANEYLVQQMPLLQGLIAQQQKIVEETVTRWAGSNKDLKAVGMAWMTGQPIDTESSIKAMIHFARNGIPPGTKFVGTSAQMLRMVEEEVRAADQPPTQSGSPSIQSLTQSAESAAERETQLMRRIQQRVGQEYNASMGLELYNSIPQMARNLDLPFKRVTDQQWQQATAFGDEKGYASVARELDMRPEDFKQMLIDGPDGPLWTERVKGMNGAEANFSVWEDKLTVAQFQSTMQHLDAHAASTGFVPSFEMHRVVSNPAFMQAAQNGENGGANASFGGFLANSAGGGNFLQNADAQASLITRAYNNYAQSAQQARINRVTALVNDPIERGQFILGAIPGLAPSQEQILLREFQRVSAVPLQRAQAGADAGAAVSGVYMPLGNADMIAEANRNIDAFILSGSSDDPAVKAALTIARRHWESLSGPITQAVERQAQRGQR